MGALRPERLVGPAEAPIGLAEAKAHLRVERPDEDELIAGLIEMATQQLDGYAGTLGRCLVEQQWKQAFSGFPRDGAIRLPLVPLVSVDTVAYIDEAGAAQVLPPSQYYAVVDAIGAALLRPATVVWPVTACRPDAVEVTFVCGYGAAADVPRPIRQAMLLMIGHLYENREASIVGTISDLPMAVAALLSPYREARA